MQKTLPRHWVEYQSKAMYNSIENDYESSIYAGSQYTENELEEVFNPCINALLFELVVFA